MVTSFRDKRKKVGVRKILISFGVSLLAVLVILPMFVRPLRPVSHVIARPFVYIGHAVHRGAEYIFLSFKSKRALQIKNEELQTENNTLILLRDANSALTKENDMLKEAFGRFEKKNTIFARVIVKPNRSLYDTLVIDGGSRAGITIGKHVVTAGGVVIGKIVEVTRSSAIVQLYSSSGVETPVRIEGQNIDVVATGRGGGNFEISIPHDISLTQGTRVLVPEYDNQLIALTKETISDAREPFQKVLLTSPVNVLELDAVFVIN